MKLNTSSNDHERRPRSAAQVEDRRVPVPAPGKRPLVSRVYRQVGAPPTGQFARGHAALERASVRHEAMPDWLRSELARALGNHVEDHSNTKGRSS